MDIEIGSLTLEKKHFFFEIDIENLNKNLNYIVPIKLFEEKNPLTSTELPGVLKTRVVAFERNLNKLSAAILRNLQNIQNISINIQWRDLHLIECAKYWLNFFWKKKIWFCLCYWVKSAKNSVEILV